MLGQTLAENGLPRPDQLRNHLAQAREHQTRLERMQTRLEKMCETLEGVDAGDPHSGLPEYLQSPAMLCARICSRNDGVLIRAL